MKIKYDKEANAIYIKFLNSKIVDSEEIKENLIVDYDENENIVGIEVLNFKENESDIDIPLIFNQISRMEVNA